MVMQECSFGQGVTPADCDSRPETSSMSHRYPAPPPLSWIGHPLRPQLSSVFTIHRISCDLKRISGWGIGLAITISRVTVTKQYNLVPMKKPGRYNAKL